MTSHHFHEMIEEHYLTNRYEETTLKGLPLSEWEMLLRHPDRAAHIKSLILQDINRNVIKINFTDHVKVIEDCLSLFTNLENLVLDQVMDVDFRHLPCQLEATAMTSSSTDPR